MPMQGGTRPTYKTIGERTHEAVLQVATEVTDELGGRSQVWNAYATEFVAMTPQPIVVSEQEATVLFIVEMPYRSDVALQHRVIVSNKVLKVIAIVDPEMRHRSLQAYCAEV